MKQTYTSTQNEEEMLKAFQQFQDLPLDILDEDDYFAIKCPFQIASNGKFHNCFLEYCMAFRHDEKTYWCAKLESKNKNKTAKYPSIKDIEGES